MDSENVIVVDFQKKPKKTPRLDLYSEFLNRHEKATEILFLLVEESNADEHEPIILQPANNNGVIYVG